MMRYMVCKSEIPSDLEATICTIIIYTVAISLVNIYEDNFIRATTIPITNVRIDAKNEIISVIWLQGFSITAYVQINNALKSIEAFVT